MANYDRQREQAVRMIKAKGTQAVLEVMTRLGEQDKPWRPTAAGTKHDVWCVVFADDGETFVDHNITGNVRIALIAPADGLTRIGIGDKLTIKNEVVNINLVKKLDPDASGAILWTALIT